MDRMLAIMAVFSLVLILLVLVSVRRAHIRVEYSVSWLVAGLILLALSQSRNFLSRLTAFMEVSDAALAILTVSGGVFLIVLYRFSILISNLKDQNIALVQRLSILEFRLESLNEKTKTATRD
jgi:hypothetical protein